MKIMYLPDTQVIPGCDISHIKAAGQYASDKRPDVIVVGGDWWDLQSLCSYDKGKKSFEGRRYQDDIKAGRDAMDAFLGPIQELGTPRKGIRTSELYKPRLVFTMGNHEQRILRAVEVQPELEGVLSYADFKLEADGFEIYQFLEVVIIEGVAFSHFFASGVMGRPMPNARLGLQRLHQSFVMGHVQKWDIATAVKADGSGITGIFGGIFYTHSFDYLGPQGNANWAGIWMLHQVEDGRFDHMQVSVDYLLSRALRPRGMR